MKLDFKDRLQQDAIDLTFNIASDDNIERDVYPQHVDVRWSMAFKVDSTGILAFKYELEYFHMPVIIEAVDEEGNVEKTTINVEVKFSIETGAYNGKIKIVCLQFFQTKIGKKVIGCVIGMTGMPTLINQAEYQYIITPEELIIGPALVSEEGEEIDKNEIDSIIEEFSEQFCKKDYFPIAFDDLLI